MIFGQGIVFGLASEMDMFDTESLLEYQGGNSCLTRPRYALTEAITRRGASITVKIHITCTEYS